jgi:hypothetical protein
MTLGVGIASYVGIMTDHMFGNLIYANVFVPYFVDLKGFRNILRSFGVSAMMGSGTPPTGTGIGDFFMLMLPVSVVERLIFTTVAIVIGVVLVRVVGRYLATWGISPLKPPTNA